VDFDQVFVTERKYSKISRHVVENPGIGQTINLLLKLLTYDAY
jgi:hypothetical protein